MYIYIFRKIKLYHHSVCCQGDLKLTCLLDGNCSLMSWKCSWRPRPHPDTVCFPWESKKAADRETGTKQYQWHCKIYQSECDEFSWIVVFLLMSSLQLTNVGALLEELFCFSVFQFTYVDKYLSPKYTDNIIDSVYKYTCSTERPHVELMFDCKFFYNGKIITLSF